MPLKLGDKTINIPFSKVYLGNVLKYQKTRIIPFSVCPFPTSWEMETNLKGAGINDYGNWTITSESSSSSLYQAFDLDTSTLWAASQRDDNVIIECPCSIQPTSFYIKHANLKDTSKIQGYNEISGAWEDLCSLTISGSFNSAKITEENLNITTNNFYSKFKIYCYGYTNTSSLRPRLYEFQITSGLIKI